MPLADEWLMYKPDCCTPASTKTQTQTSRTNAKKVIDQIMGDASKSAQMYGSLDEFIPLHIDKLSMAKQREGKYQKKPKLKQPKVKLIERRRPQSATIVRNRYAQGRQIAPNLQHDAFRLGPYNTRRKKKQRPKTASLLYRHRKQGTNKHEIAIRPPSPDQVHTTRLRAKKKLGRKAKNKASPPRRKILAERIVEEEKRQREVHLLQMDQYKNSIRPTSPQTKENQGRHVVNESQDSNEMNVPCTDAKFQRPRSPTPSSMLPDNEVRDASTTNAHLLQLEFDDIKEFNRQKRAIQRHEMFRQTYSMIHRGVTARSPRLSPKNCGGFKNSVSPKDRVQKHHSLAQNASAIQHDRLHHSIEIESIESLNVKQNLSKKVPVAPSLESTKISKRLIQRNSDEVNKIVVLSTQTTNLLNASNGGNEKPLSVVGSKSEVLENTKNISENVATKMRDLEYVHYDARQSNQSEEIRKRDRMACKTKKTTAARKERPKTATSTRMKQKRGKVAVPGQRRRPKSASYSTRNRRAFKYGVKQVTNPLLRQMYSPRYRHIVYSVPIKQNSTKEVFRRIAEIEVKPDLTKNRETDLRVSADARSYQIYRAVSSQRNSPFRSQPDSSRGSNDTASSSNPHRKTDPRRTKVSNLNYSNYQQDVLSKINKGSNLEASSLSSVLRTSPRVVHMNKLIENHFDNLDKANELMKKTSMTKRHLRANNNVKRSNQASSGSKKAVSSSGTKQKLQKFKKEGHKAKKRRPQSAKPGKKQDSALDIYRSGKLATIGKKLDESAPIVNGMSQTSVVLRDQAFEEYKKVAKVT